MGLFNFGKKKERDGEESGAGNVLSINYGTSPTYGAVAGKNEVVLGGCPGIPQDKSCLCVVTHMSILCQPCVAIWHMKRT